MKKVVEVGNLDDLRFYLRPKFNFFFSMKNLCFLLPAVLFLAFCSTSKKAKTPVSDLLLLKKSMTGSFNSSAQAARDTDFFDITLHMYPIWEDRPEHWIYVEQTVTANPQKPYRQRVYRLEQRDAETFVSHVYTMKSPKDFVLAWKSPEKFKALTVNDIDLKSGCEVVLKKQRDGSFSGSTGKQTCPSELRGAKFATSAVSVFSDKILSWDQGFNADGKQVWGAEKGGYEFLKIQN